MEHMNNRAITGTVEHTQHAHTVCHTAVQLSLVMEEHTQHADNEHFMSHTIVSIIHSLPEVGIFVVNKHVFLTGLVKNTQYCNNEYFIWHKTVCLSLKTGETYTECKQ